jgi:hypothetical protein
MIRLIWRGGTLCTRFSILRNLTQKELSNLGQVIHYLNIPMRYNRINIPYLISNCFLITFLKYPTISISDLPYLYFSQWVYSWKLPLLGFWGREIVLKSLNIRYTWKSLYSIYQFPYFACMSCNYDGFIQIMVTNYWMCFLS